MDWQNAFYAIGTIFLVLLTIVLFLIAYLLIKLRFFVTHLGERAKEKAESLIDSRKSEIAGGVATVIGTYLLNAVKKKISK